MDKKITNKQDKNNQSQKFIRPIDIYEQEYTEIKNSKFLDRKTKKQILKHTKKLIKETKKIDY